MTKRDNQSDSVPDPQEGNSDQPSGQPTDRPSGQSIGDYPQLPKIISFASLARCGDEVWIENNGQIYRLRKTKQDKLILTK